MNEYNVITSPGEGEFEDKKSRFIGHALPVTSETEALMLIDQIKRKYWDARHNCYAFITGDNGEIQRFSDDGEPGGTAGRPILEVLTGDNLRGILVVVTRYFGGTLLGTGGLVRAYTKATQACLDNAGIQTKVYGSKISISVDYSFVGKLQYYFAENNIFIESDSYTDKVIFEIIVKEENVSDVLESVTSATNGKAELCIIDTGFFLI